VTQVSVAGGGKRTLKLPKEPYKICLKKCPGDGVCGRHPSLETALMFIFAYLPYLLAEALNLSGIMAILFCGACC